MARTSASINYKCNRIDCVYCCHTANGIYCGFHNRYVNSKDIKECKDGKDRFS